MQGSLLPAKEKNPYRKSGLQIWQNFFRHICGYKEKLESVGTFGFVAFKYRTSLASTFLSRLMFYQHRLRRNPMYWHWQEVAFGKLHFSLDNHPTSGCVKQISISAFISSHLVKPTAKSYPVSNGTNLRNSLLSPLQKNPNLLHVHITGPRLPLQRSGWARPSDAVPGAEERAWI